ncbi:MAG TPA: hypothetical protein VGB79_07770 [Allosphingosinicella sp.]
MFRHSAPNGCKGGIGITTNEDSTMAKGQKKSNKEARKPKAEAPKKQNASNPSTKQPQGMVGDINRR